MQILWSTQALKVLFKDRFDAWEGQQHFLNRSLFEKRWKHQLEGDRLQFVSQKSDLGKKLGQKDVTSVLKWMDVFLFTLYLSNSESPSFVQVIIIYHVEEAASIVNKRRRFLDELLERAIDWGADFGALVKVDCRYSTLANALWGELEFLRIVLAVLEYSLDTTLSILPCTHPCKHHWHQTGSAQIAHSNTAPNPWST